MELRTELPLEAARRESRSIYGAKFGAADAHLSDAQSQRRSRNARSDSPVSLLQLEVGSTPSPARQAREAAAANAGAVSSLVQLSQRARAAESAEGNAL